MLKKELLILLGNKVKKIRESKNLSQNDLAIKIGKDQQSIQRLETGKINPSFYYLHEISCGLEIKITELLEFEESITSK